MLTGIKFRAYPTAEQKQALSQWMGAGRVIWNAKYNQWQYESTYARKYLPVGTYACIDQTYSQFKDKELTPYLFQVPSQVLRNSAVNWFTTMQNWLDPQHPQTHPAKNKKKLDRGSVHLTKELFRFETDLESSRLRLFIGTTRKPLGYLEFNQHGLFQIPNSIRVKKNAGIWWVSFCYDDAVDEKTLLAAKTRLELFRKESEESLQNLVIGIDRGIAVAAHTDSEAFDYTPIEKENFKKKQIRLKRYQRQMARQKKGSNSRAKTKGKIARVHQKIANIRYNFCHQVSHRLTKTDDTPAKIIVMEDLKIKNMTKAPKPKKNPETGKWEKNGASRKAGLNKAILSIGWHKLETLVKYKVHRRGGLFVKISPHFSSQECAGCGHIHPDNRVSQALFVCKLCGNRDNADRNAAQVLKKRAIKLILNSGSELSDKGVLFLPDIGRGAQRKTSRVKPRSRSKEASKKMEVSKIPPEALAL